MLRRFMYGTARLLGDIEAAKKGRLGRRVARRMVGRMTGRMLRRMLR